MTFVSFEPQPTDQQPGILTIAPQGQLWVENTLKTHCSERLSQGWLVRVIQRI